jgi:hypothetical protein
MAGQDFPVRWLTLGMPGSAKSSYTAGYWLQSSSRVTDDYAVRIWDDLQPQPESWVLVTILFDQPVDPSSGQVVALFNALRTAIQGSLQPVVR